MAEERDEGQFGEGQGQFDKDGNKQPSAQQGQQSEFAQQQGQQAGGMGSQETMSGQASDLGAGSGQPIGGNDSQTGSGTTMSQGADFGRQSSSGQAQPEGSSKTLTTDQSSQSESDTTGQSGGQGSSGEGFIGSQGSGSSEYLQEGGSSSNATGGTDFASQGQGAREGDERDVESGQPRAQDKDSDIEGSSNS